MTASVGKINRPLELCGTDGSDILKAYDLETDSWKFPQIGEFWETVRAAHKDGLTGHGKRIAIVDSGPDLNIPRLSKQVTLTELGRGGPHSHGTAVALLISSIAPDADIFHFDISDKAETSEKPIIRQDLFFKAIKSISNLNIDYLCLSLGDDQPMIPAAYAGTAEFLNNYDLIGLADYIKKSPIPAPRIDECMFRTCYCEAVEKLKPHKPVILCAAGNKMGKTFCPARSTNTFSVGFMNQVKTFMDGDMKAAVAPPTYSQSLHIDLDLQQPNGISGSSFAAPLMTAILALRETPTELEKLIAHRYISRAGAAIENLVEDSRMQNKRLEAPLVDKLMAIYKTAWSPTNYVNRDNLTPSQKLEARLFLAGSVTDKSRYMIWSGRPDLAIKFMEWVCRLAPWMPAAHANWANAVMNQAASHMDNPAHIDDILQSLDIVVAAYERALKLDPGNKAFQEGLENALKLHLDISIYSSD